MLSETITRLEWIRIKIGEKEKTNLSSGLETIDHTISCLQCLPGFFHYGRNFHTHAVKIFIYIFTKQKCLLALKVEHVTGEIAPCDYYTFLGNCPPTSTLSQHQHLLLTLLLT